jgi:TonB family protein
MLNLARFRNYLSLPALAMLFALAIAFPRPLGAQSASTHADDSQFDSVPIVLNQKQSAHMLLVQPHPKYPAIARVNLLQGHVQLQLTVNGSGKVVNAHVLHGDAVFAAAALKDARGWVYRPLTTPAGKNGFITSVEMKYSLKVATNGLTPKQAEMDFMRQVKPPQAIQPQEGTHPGDDLVHLRLLVDDEGKVDDIDSSSLGPASVEAARKSLQNWTFRPAHWGNLPIASYINIDVPLNTVPVAAVSHNR